MKPGDIFRLPSADPDARDPKDGRPHVLVSLLEVDNEIATVVYCSTASWEVGMAAPPHVVIEPTSGTFAATGLSRRTVAYPGRLATCFVDDLDLKCGVLLDEMPALQSELLRAIGFRTGVSRSTASPAAGSFRGTVLRFTAEFAEFSGAEFGLVISEPAYSRRAQFQNFVPLYHEADFPASASTVDVEVQSLLKAPANRMRAVPRLVQSCHQRFDVLTTVGHVDDDSMAQVEDELAIRFFGSVIAAETISL